MAIAGKVAITLSTENGGSWSADVTYDRLVAVKHNNNLYISRKTVANVEPPNDEFWFLALEGFGGDDVESILQAIENIINGTTQVGNAKTLDGHGAEYFASVYGYPLNSFYGNSEAEIDQFLNELHANATNRYFYSAELSFGTPHSQLGSSNSLIVGSRTNASYGWQMAITYGNNADRIRYRQMYGGTWNNWDSGAFVSDLANYLPKSGGEVGTDEWKIYSLGVKNIACGVQLRVDTSGNAGLYDSKNSVWLLYRTYGETPIFNGTASENLPLKGGVLSAPVEIILGVNSEQTNNSYIEFKGKNVYNGSLGFAGANNPVFLNNTNAAQYPLLHTGNKPSGTYTGNGSAYKSIVIGGIGEYVLVSANVSGEKSDFVLVSYNGYFGKVNGSPVSGNNMHTTTGGNLIIDGVTAFLVSGRQYRYERL